jgi:hypothetical protein
MTTSIEVVIVEIAIINPVVFFGFDLAIISNYVHRSSLCAGSGAVASGARLALAGSRH